MLTLSSLRKELRSKADPKKAKLLQRYFKTGPVEYAEGDVFAGITNPIMRGIAKQFGDLGLGEVEKILHSRIHEERQTALLILVHQFQDAMTRHNMAVRDKIFNFYLRNTKYINNWDLVDLSAPKIAGEYLLNKPRAILYRLAKSKNLWEKRIAVLSTFAFIRERQFGDSLKIAEILLNDSHDLMHKAVGWALREVGKKSLSTEEKFLKRHYKKMPRTMLRYAIEKFPENKRKAYLGGRI